jgi:hypothetical protein
VSKHRSNFDQRRITSCRSGSSSIAEATSATLTGSNSYWIVATPKIEQRVQRTPRSDQKLKMEQASGVFSNPPIPCLIPWKKASIKFTLYDKNILGWIVRNDGGRSIGDSTWFWGLERTLLSLYQTIWVWPRRLCSGHSPSTLGCQAGGRMRSKRSNRLFDFQMTYGNAFNKTVIKYCSRNSLCHYVKRLRDQHFLPFCWEFYFAFVQACCVSDAVRTQSLVWALV